MGQVCSICTDVYTARYDLCWHKFDWLVHGVGLQQVFWCRAARVDWAWVWWVSFETLRDLSKQGFHWGCLWVCFVLELPHFDLSDISVSEWIRHYCLEKRKKTLKKMFTLNVFFFLNTRCQPGYRGNQCQFRYDLCSIANPCVVAGSSCVTDSNNQASCTCPTGNKTVKLVSWCHCNSNQATTLSVSGILLLLCHCWHLIGCSQNIRAKADTLVC